MKSGYGSMAAILSKEWFCSRQSTKFAGATVPRVPSESCLSQSITRRSGWGYGRGFRMTPFTTVNMAAFAPIPSASVSTATTAKPGDLRSTRVAKRKSCHSAATKDSQPAERTTSFVTSRFPRSRRTARSASLRLMPCFIFSSAAISRKLRTSSSSSLLTRSFRNSHRHPSDRLRSSDMGPHS